MSREETALGGYGPKLGSLVFESLGCHYKAGMMVYGCFLVLAVLEILIVLSASVIMDRKSSTVVSRDRSGLVLEMNILREVSSALLEMVIPFGRGLLSGATELATMEATLPLA